MRIRCLVLTLFLVANAAMGSDLLECFPGDHTCSRTADIDRSMLQVQHRAGDVRDTSEEEDAMEQDISEDEFAFKIYKPKVEVPKPMPVIIGSTRERDELTKSVDGLGHATVIWTGNMGVGKSDIGGFKVCKQNHPLVKLFGEILDAIEDDPDLDENKVAATGYSATAKSATLFSCHADRLTGIYASCSGFDVKDSGCGLSLTGACNKKKSRATPYEGQCEDCQKTVMTNCEVTRNCTTVGGYPCFKKKPFIVVAQTGTSDPYKYESDLLYEAAKAEGLDARYQIYDFGHKKPLEIGATIMGTFGFGEYCPPECEEAVKKCIAKKKLAKGVRSNLDQCLAWPTEYRPTECPKFCIPTLSLLYSKKENKGKLIKHEGKYGPAQKMVEVRPAKSKCSYDDYKR